LAFGGPGEEDRRRVGGRTGGDGPSARPTGPGSPVVGRDRSGLHARRSGAADPPSAVGVVAVEAAGPPWKRRRRVETPRGDRSDPVRCSTRRASGAANAPRAASSRRASSRAGSRRAARATARPAPSRGTTRVASPMRRLVGVDRAAGEDEVECDAEPTTRGSRTVPPSISGTPHRRQNTPNVAVSATTRRSHQSASSRPPATACPSTAAIVGLRVRRRVGPIGPSRVSVRRFRRDSSVSACRSAPAQKVPPAPVRTPATRSSSASSSSNAASRADAVGPSTALRTSGRSMVTTRTGPSRSVRTAVLVSSATFSPSSPGSVPDLVRSRLGGAAGAERPRPRAGTGGRRNEPCGHPPGDHRLLRSARRGWASVWGCSPRVREHPDGRTLCRSTPARVRSRSTRPTT
jgi:hypothetical protein